MQSSGAIAAGGRRADGEPSEAGAAAPRAGRQPLALVPALCGLCGVDDADPVGVGEDFEYRTCTSTFLAVRCRRCGLVYLNPRPADGAFGRIYPDDYHAFASDAAEGGLIYRVRRRLEARRVLGWCKGLPADARVLDVGCGDGFHLRLLRDFGRPTWSLQGVDTDARAVAAAKRHGLDVRHGTVADVDRPAGGFHLVLLVMTVEHLADPVGVLTAIRRLLAPGGRVGIVTDNVGSPDFKIAGGRHWGGYHFPRHLALFDRNTLAKLAAAAGLTVEKIGTAVSPVNWTYSLRNWVDDWGGPRWLVDRLSLRSAVPLAIFTLLDTPLAWVGRGAILRASFVNRESTPGVFAGG